ncbi:hypothetical protein HHK36_017490 [Tetracentron sinense]|uniref:Uncharacterized protein n=1 Tax=Tetracentron sinense TaxID=13715 RepID=A0A834YYY6_TETSI|nr:hypothetical protein HHK36_017490 [Tetracentron sinense]
MEFSLLGLLILELDLLYIDTPNGVEDRLNHSKPSALVNMINRLQKETLALGLMVDGIQVAGKNRIQKPTFCQKVGAPSTGGVMKPASTHVMHHQLEGDVGLDVWGSDGTGGRIIKSLTSGCMSDRDGTPIDSGLEGGRITVLNGHVIYILVRMLIFHSTFNWKHWVGLFVTSMAYLIPYQQLAKMANPSYADDGELLDGGFDMSTGGVCGKRFFNVNHLYSVICEMGLVLV